MKIGYAFINDMRSHHLHSSSTTQNLQVQEEALRRSGCTEIFTDIIIGVKPERPKLEKALAYLEENDTLVVCELDKLGTSISHLIETIKFLEERNISLQSIKENFDTSTEAGKLIFEVFYMLAEIVDELQESDFGLQNFEKNIDMTTSVGKVVFHVFNALAEVERDLIKERSQVWFKTFQKAKNMTLKRGGRPPSLSNEKINEMLVLYELGKNNIHEICEIYGISRPNFYYYLKKRKMSLL